MIRQNETPWAEVGKSHPHESAVLHVSGSANYTDDIPETQGTLHAALGLSAQACAGAEHGSGCRATGAGSDCRIHCP
jgi:xanthine dehydrogenase large subunit